MQIGFVSEFHGSSRSSFGQSAKRDGLQAPSDSFLQPCFVTSLRC